MAKYPDALVPLMNWFRITRRADWDSLADVRQDFAHADIVGGGERCSTSTATGADGRSRVEAQRHLAHTGKQGSSH
ncbi:MAG: type II toxin-antitoxin system HigB family toxin [Bryobacterales bacterium]|nr:type II toxin-antitoxin system HigB family toxin [Bryobacterales bacterium]